MSELIAGVGRAGWSANRSMAQQYIPALFYEGLSGAGVLRALREMDVGYRTKDFYSDFRNITGYEKGKASVLGLGQNAVVPTNLWATQPPGYRNRFRYDVSNIVESKETGAFSVQTRSLYTDDILTVGEVENLMGDRWETFLRGYPVTIVDAKLVGVWAREE